MRAWWRRNFMPAELGVAIAAAVAFAVWSEALGGYSEITDTLQGNRAQLYAALASVWGALLGFAITAVSVVLGYSSSERLTLMRRSRHYPKMWKVFFSAIAALAIATAVALLGLLADRDTDPASAILYLNGFTTAFAAIRLYRVVWILEQTVTALTTEIPTA
jgi:hypothetical protein